VPTVVSRAQASKGSLVEAIGDACSSFYGQSVPDAKLSAFTYRGFNFLFHGNLQFDRTALLIGHPGAPSEARDVMYQRGFSLVETFGGRSVDRGNFIPYTADGSFGPNLYVQDRALNRGRSKEGRQYRSLGRSAVAAGPNALMFAHPVYVAIRPSQASFSLGLLLSPALSHKSFAIVSMSSLLGTRIVCWSS